MLMRKHDDDYLGNLAMLIMYCIAFDDGDERDDDVVVEFDFYIVDSDDADFNHYFGWHFEIHDDVMVMIIISLW